MKRVEAARFIGKSYTEQIKELPIEGLEELLLKENIELAKLGVKTSISLLAYGAKIHGGLYEDKIQDGEMISTPMNFFMTLIHHYEPDLLQLPKNKFQDLGRTVSRIAMIVDALEQKPDFYRFPKQFHESPQKQLSLRKP
jgi:hypothetical protein